MKEQIRWRQRFNNFQRSLRILETLQKRKLDELSEVERIGYVKLFELTFEVAWKTLKNFLEYRGVDQQLLGSKDTIRAAFRADLIAKGEDWMVMVKTRNQLTHRYDELAAKALLTQLQSSTIPLFHALEQQLLSQTDEP